MFAFSNCTEKPGLEHLQILDMHALHHVLHCSAGFQSHSVPKLFNFCAAASKIPTIMQKQTIEINSSVLA